MATEFELSVSGSSRELFDAIHLLAENNINIDTVATAKVGDRYVLKFLTALEEECRRTFIKADLPFKERRVLVMDIRNRPGEWVRVARELAEAGVDINASYMVRQEGDTMRFVFGVSDYERAKKIACEKNICGYD